MIEKRSIISIILFSLILYSCVENNTQPENQNQAETFLDKKDNQISFYDLKLFSKTFAQYLNNYHNQKFLEKHIRESKYVENIIELSEFLQLQNREGGSTKTIKEDLLALNNHNEIVQKFTDIDFGLIDIYFPYKEHYKQWEAGDELIVVPVSNHEVEKNKYVDGYNVYGDIVRVSTEVPANVPVIAIAFSEKRGSYKAGWNRDHSFEKNRINSITSTSFQYRLVNIYIKKDYDSGWLLGDMEIYVKTKQNTTVGGGYGSWHEHGTWSVQDNNAYDLPTPYPILEAQNDDDWEIQIEVWEDDGWGSGSDDFVADVNYNAHRIGVHYYEDQGDWLPWYGSITDIPYDWGGLSLYPDIQIMDGIDLSQDYDCIVLRRTAD